MARFNPLTSLALAAILVAPAAFAQDPVLSPTAEIVDKMMPIVDTPSPSPSPTPALDGFSVGAQIGGSVSMAPASDSLLTPVARISVSGPLALGSASADKLPVLHVDGELAALPGDTIDQAGGISSTLAQFKSLDFTLGLSYRVSKWLSVNGGKHTVATSVYAEAGFATRLDNEHKARDKAPRYGCGGLRFDEAGGSFVKAGMCADQRLDGSYQATATVTGNIVAFNFGESAGAAIYVKAILGLNFSSPDHPELTGGARDSVNVGTLFGWGGK